MSATNTEFETIYRDNAQAVRAFARSIVGRNGPVDDVVQETFIRAWRFLPTYRGEGSLQGWILRICHNTAMNTVSRTRTHEQLSGARALLPDNCGEVELLLLIDGLERNHRTVMVLCLVLGHSYAEAADLLGVAEGTVKSRLFRAREEVQLALAESERPPATGTEC